ncbi:MAG: RHS repeat-associated core domain-containing protein, partial [Myxococcota bacterium]
TFTYDALYRLTRATGREKVDQRQTTAFYAEYAGATGAIPDPGDPALRQYTQSYRYDGVGNLLEMKHQQGLGGMVAWRRGYAYEPSNNQLVSTSAPGDDPDDPSIHTNRYPYNVRGAMTAMPHLPALVRDPQDQIRRADLDLAGSVAWYAYDAGGQRVRKRVDKGGVQEERIYVGGYEVWRKRTGSGVQEERQTLHVLDDQRRIALVETLTVTNGSAVPNPTSRQRYQLGDHLGTATLEVDEVGAIISYEEYHPFGTTAWWATDGGTEVSAKRYRYSGKEQDEETGLARHGVRGNIPWLGRWERPDPIGLQGGINRYRYASNDPVGRSDPYGMEDTRWTDESGQRWLANDSDGPVEEIAVEERGETPRGLWDKPFGKALAFVGGLAVGAATSIAVAAGAAALIAAAPVAGAVAVGAAAVVGAGALLYGVISDDDFGRKVERLFTGRASASEYFGAGFFVGGFAGGSPAAKPAVQASKKAGIGARLLYEVTVTDLGSTSTAAATRFAGDEVSVVAGAMAPKGADLGLRGPASRHKLSGVKQGTVAKELYTVIEPGIDVAGDVAAINQGFALRVGNNFHLNGRVYGSHDGTLYPISGQGFHQLNRGAYQALGVLNKFGDTPKAQEILGRMHNVGPEEIEAASAAWRAGR